MAGDDAGGRRAADVLFSVALAALVAAAYSPSLKHSPRADQWAYLADTAHCRDFPHLLDESYSHNRTAVIAAGDTDLFRPLLFLLLATEKHVFGGDFRFPQAIGVALHGCVCFLLLALLRRMAAGSPPRVDLLPYGVVAFFALNPFVMELVVWHHLHGYLLFLVLMLGSLVCLLRHVEEAGGGGPARRWLWAAWALALLAAFAYELGQVYAVLAGAFLAAAVYPRAGRRGAARAFALFAGVLLIYQAANAVDRRVHEGRYEPDDGNRRLIRERAAGPETVTNAARFGVYTAVQPFFPAAFRWSFARERLVVAEGVWAGAGMRTLGPDQVVSYSAFALAAGLAAAGLWRVARAGTRVRRLTVLLAAGLYATYGAVTVFGRMNVRNDPPALVLNSYYAYTGLVLALLVFGAAWGGLDCGGRWTARARAGLLAGLVALSLAGAEHVRQVNESLTHRLQEYTIPLRAVQEFVATHRHEPGFSFAIDYGASERVPMQWERPVTEAVFARWTATADPKYRIVIRDGKVLAAPAAAGSTGR